MKIKVIDTFGTHVGDAEVTWLPRSESTPGIGIAEEVQMIFAPVTVVSVPTVNQRMPWRFEVTIDGS